MFFIEWLSAHADPAAGEVGEGGGGGTKVRGRDNVLDEGTVPSEGGGLRPGKAARGRGKKEGGAVRRGERGEPEE